MTPDQHRAIGRILGYPECCVEAWIADGDRLPNRGVMVERLRTPSEAIALAGQVSDLLGRTWPRPPAPPTHDLRKAYVPCPAHVGAPGWEP